MWKEIVCHKNAVEIRIVNDNTILKQIVSFTQSALTRNILDCMSQLNGMNNSI